MSEPGARTLIASDWHLGRHGSTRAARLALAFLRRADEAGDAVILNGDIFEGLFEPVALTQAAHPELAAMIESMESTRRLRRTEGNHDPGAGPPSIVLPHEALGRVFVAHGHAVDPVRNSLPGRIGDAISRRFGWMPVVRGAARLAEITAAALASNHVERVFSARCRTMVENAGCALGIFGHIHRQYLSSGDSYVNAGHLTETRLEFVALTPDGPALGHFDLSDAESPGSRVAESADSER